MDKLGSWQRRPTPRVVGVSGYRSLQTSGVMVKVGPSPWKPPNHYRKRVSATSCLTCSVSGVFLVYVRRDVRSPYPVIATCLCWTSSSRPAVAIACRFKDSRRARSWRSRKKRSIRSDEQAACLNDHGQTSLECIRVEFVDVRRRCDSWLLRNKLTQ